MTVFTSDYDQIRFNYFFKFTAAVLLPLVLLTGVAITYCVIKHPRNALSKMSDAKAKATTITMAFIIVFILYPFVSQTIFQGFSCRSLALDESWLTADYQVSCDGFGWKFWLFWGLLTALLWPIGVPAFTLLILMRKREFMWIKDSPERDRFAFIVGDYKPEYYFWECLEMLRKVSLTGLLIFFSKGSLLQIVVAVMITFAFLIATSRNMPFKDDLANKFKLATECCLMITLIFAIMLKVDLRKEVVTADQIGFILLLNNTIVPGATLILGYLMAMKAAGTDADDDDWYKGTFDQTTGILTFFDPEKEDKPHPDFDPKEDRNGEQKGWEMENPMLSTDDEDGDKFTDMEKKQLDNELKAAGLSKLALAKTLQGSDEYKREILHKQKAAAETEVVDNVLASDKQQNSQDMMLASGFDEGDIVEEDEVDTVKKLDENIDVEAVDGAANGADEYTTMKKKELQRELTGASLPKKDLAKALKGSDAAMRKALRKQKLEAGDVEAPAPAPADDPFAAMRAAKSVAAAEEPTSMET